MTERHSEHGTFVIERAYEAPPQRVFAAFTTEEAKQRWFGGPDDWETTEYAMEQPEAEHDSSLPSRACFWTARTARNGDSHRANTARARCSKVWQRLSKANRRYRAEPCADHFSPGCRRGDVAGYDATL